MKYFNYFGSMVTNYAKCSPEIKARISMEKEHSKTNSTNELNLMVKLVKLRL